MADVSAPKGKVVRSEKLRAVLDMQCKVRIVILDWITEPAKSDVEDLNPYSHPCVSFLSSTSSPGTLLCTLLLRMVTLRQ